MKYIKDFEDGNRIDGIYYCKSKISTETKNGKPYDSLVLQDKTGTIDTKVWSPYDPGIREYEAGDFIEVKGDVIIFNNADITSASYEIIGVVFQKSCLAGSEKSGDEVDFTHGIHL